MKMTFLQKYTPPPKGDEEKLANAYEALTESNKQKVLKRANFLITFVVCVYALVILACIGVGIYLVLSKQYVETLAMVVLMGLAIYFTILGASWFKAKPHHKILLVLNFTRNLLMNQEKEN
ncbi:MAG: hypothetical protein IJT25_02415 [Clostridia bacterium]|nr:hypothetical protein [Clostridia bacterium]